jgi:acyl-CoA synthetase (AMP-forming)/AMP-acid ligase II/thioesterase domain-containing protein/NAD(P)-dependent dehydrogenase (short-subunit alcohol dehydrogenase family)
MSVSPANSSIHTEAASSASIDNTQQSSSGQPTGVADSDEQRIARALLAHPSIDDCAALLRKTEASQQEVVAYVVLKGPFSAEGLHSHLQSNLPEIILPKINFVPVSGLPLTAEGELDEQALTRLAVIDSELVRQWEETLQSQPEIEQVAVIVQEQAEKVSPLHLSDLLPDWEATHPIATGAKIAPAAPSTTPSAETDTKPLATSQGVALELEAEAPTNLGQALKRATICSPDKGITYIQADGSDTTQLYPALLEEAERILAGLRELGLKPQDQVIFQFDSNQDYIPAFWGCILGGFVPVPVSAAPTYDPANSVVKKLINAWQRLEQPPILTNKTIAPQLRTLSEQLNLENCQVETIEDLRSRDRDSNWHDSQPDDLAVLLLTSGSTGIPKGVMLTHGNILSNVAASSQINQFTRNDSSLNWLRLDHVGSLVRCSIRDIYVGSQQIHAPAELVLENPLRLLDWIERYRVTFAWAPNFALGLINDRADTIKHGHWDLSSLRSMLSVAEAIVPKTAKRFTELLTPHGFSADKMHAAWGMSETCAAVTFSHDYLLKLSEEATCVEVGTPTPGFEMRIVDGQDRVIAEDAIGRLQIRGPMIVSGYYQNPELNQEVFTPDGWLKTGDLGFIHDGRLTITGREKDLIIINGLNHYSYEIEAVVEEVEGVEVSYTAACAIREPGSDTDRLLIFFHTPSREDDRLVEILKDIRSNIVRKTGVSPTYLIPVEKETIPKTSIGKIQRLQLKQRFEAGEFDAIVKRVDILLGNENTLPDWFYQKIWRPKAAVTLDSQPRTGQSLLFLDSLGLGESLCAEFERRNQPYIAVEAGLDFAQLADNRYRIDPKHPEHYQQLLASVSTEDSPIEQVLHLWTYDEYAGEVATLEALESAQDKGIYSLLLLVQALAQVQGNGTNVRVQVITSHSQATSLQEVVAYEKSPILGSIKTFPKEVPWLDCTHLDLPVTSVEENAAHILRELQVLQEEREVAYRQGQRLVPCLQKVDLLQESERELPFQQGGMYLISGGLGGIGVEIAQYLLQNYQARLLLVGRTPLPPRDTWETHLEQEDSLAARLEAYQSLEQLEGEVAYEAVDICEPVQLRQVVEQVKHRWQCELDGVIHLAGIAPERLLLEESPASLAATLRPKVSGAWVLDQLVKEQPNCLFVSFSSVISFFGGATVGGYAAANSFLDCFGHHQRYQQSLRSYCFGSSTWRQIGVNRGYQGGDSRRAQGQIAMSVTEGVNSFLAGLHRDQPQLIFGLDGSNRTIQRYTNGEARPVQKLSAYLVTETDWTTKQQDLERHFQQSDHRICDRFGTPSVCEFLPVQEIPLTETGEIDRERLTPTGQKAAAERVEPRTEAERKLVGIWQEVLGIPQIGIHDNFFELGGTSVLAARIFPLVDKEFGQNLPLAILFQAPTVEQLAQILTQEDDSISWSSLVPIQPNGSKLPFYCVHAGFGEVLGFDTLARHLGSDQPFYALRPVGLDGVREPLNTVEEMAAHYLAEIRAFQPEGPYLLGGACTGGTVAFEMAQQLKAQGQEVALLALIDTAYPQLVNYFTPRYRYYRQDNKPRFRFDEKDYLFYAFVALYHLRELKLRRAKHVSPMFQEMGLAVKRTISRILRGREVSWHQEIESLDPIERQTFVKDRFFEAFLQALKRYEPKPYSGKVNFFLPTLNSYVPIAYPGQLNSYLPNQKTVKNSPPLLLGWNKVARGGFEVHEFDVKHDYMGDEPHVRKLAEKLQFCLDSANIKRDAE